MTDFKIPVLSVKQWVSSWERAEWHAEEGLPEPPKEFYVGSVSISLLRALSGVSHRELPDRRQKAPDTGYQRPHDRERSEKVARYIQWGYPLSSQKTLSPDEFPDLIHPGWLPTAILVNVLDQGDSRRRFGKSVQLQPGSEITISEDGSFHSVSGRQMEFSPEDLAPLEVIDGQHRLFAVDELEGDLRDYEVPVVFFKGLTPQWQAYLFWVINVEPRKINPSLAFDLYPELRSQTWLEKGEWIKVYREHRAQELVEVLWRHPSSPWEGRIELMGKRVPGHVSNAAFIRSLMASFIRPYKIGKRFGGLFGAIDKRGTQYAIPWKRAQQAAFLIRIWQHMSAAVDSSNAPWVASFKKREYKFEEPMPAFQGQFSLLATDQGVRAILNTYNVAMQLKADVPLDEWYMADVTDQPDVASVDSALESLRRIKVVDDLLAAIAKKLVSSIDWRTSAHPDLTDAEKLAQGVYRGSSGYSALTSRAISSIADVIGLESVSEAEVQEASDGDA